MSYNNIEGHKGFVKGMAPWNKGKKFTNSDRGKQNKSNICKDTFIYNNGEVEIRLRIGEEIPEGFVKGRIITEERHKQLSEMYKKINEEKWRKWREEHNG